MWFMDEAQGEEKTIRSLVLRILTVNFASIHTTSMVRVRSLITPSLSIVNSISSYLISIVSSFNTFPPSPVSLLLSLTPPHLTHQSFTHALFRLAANPEFIGPMRDEVTEIINEEGWTRKALQRMRRVDSFLRESHRCHGLGSSKTFSFFPFPLIHMLTFTVALSPLSRHPLLPFRNPLVLKQSLIFFLPLGNS